MKSYPDTIHMGTKHIITLLFLIAYVHGYDCHSSHLARIHIQT